MRQSNLGRRISSLFYTDNIHPSHTHFLFLSVGAVGGGREEVIGDDKQADV